MTWTPSPATLCTCGSRRGEHPTATCTNFRRSKRGHRDIRTTPRSRVVGVRRTTRAIVRAVVEASAALMDDDTVAALTDRPRTRGDCVDGPRPCPWVSCRHHLGIEVTPAGGLKLVRPDREPWELEQTCSLDVADAGEHTLDVVGRLTNVTRERTRQIEAAGVRLVRKAMR